MALSVADIYGTTQTGRDNSNANMNPSVDKPKAKQAQADATGTTGAGINYGVFALLAFFGILLGLKYGLEKRGN
jgi:hypothetical protein